MLHGVIGASFLSTYAHAGPNDFTPLSSTPTVNYAPAVDGVNGKSETFGGAISNRALAGNAGALTLPVTGNLGAQIDAAFGSFDQRGFGNIAGHFFWRNPNQALFGIYSSYTAWDQWGGAYVGQVAAEGEYYVGRFTVQGIAGVEWGNHASMTGVFTSTVPPTATPIFGGPGTPGVTTTTTLTSMFDVKTRFFDMVNFKYYFTDDTLGYIGHRYLGGKNALALGGEYAFPIRGALKVSAFLEGRVGESNVNGVWGGLKFYMDPKDKPLIARHRQDDPNIWSTDTLFSIVNSLTTSGSSSSSQFCNSPATLQSNGTCESFVGPPL